MISQTTFATAFIIRLLGWAHKYQSQYIVPDQAWSPYFVKDVEVLENVQKAATNLVLKLRKYSYPVRLQMIGITSLKERKKEEPEAT